MMWWRKNPNSRINRLLQVLTEFEQKFFKLVSRVEILEIRISNALVKKRLKDPRDLEEKTENIISPDGLDELRRLA